jgi:hypothetical protein
MKAMRKCNDEIELIYLQFLQMKTQILCNFPMSKNNYLLNPTTTAHVKIFVYAFRIYIIIIIILLSNKHPYMFVTRKKKKKEKKKKKQCKQDISNNSDIRRGFTKIRIRNHNLEIEKGRYFKIPRILRLCKTCNKIEDEEYL